MDSVGAQETRGSGSRRGVAPALTLVVLAPFIAEVLSGSTRLSYIFVFIPEMMVWGCGALVIRELVRRWGGGVTSMLTFGLALAVAQEFLIQQTSLAPMPWITGPIYGREWGVNWPFFLFLLGYESIWVVLVPVQIVELLFPDRRNGPWLRIRGLVVAGLTFLLGALLAWFLWTQVARPKKFHVPPYHPSSLLLGIGAAASVLLVICAYALRRRKQTSPDHQRTPRAWVVGLAVLILASGWYVLITLVFAPTLQPHFSFWFVMAAGVVWAVIAYALLRNWSSADGWSDLHRWAAAFAATLVCMLAGFGGSSAWPRMDLIAKIVMNVVAFLGLVWLGVDIWRRNRDTAPHRSTPSS